MKIQMRVQMSGLRNGEEWPAVGDEIDLPDEEAAALCAIGNAVPVESSGNVETATKSDQAVNRTAEGA